MAEQADLAALLASSRAESVHRVAYRPGELVSDPAVDAPRVGIVCEGAVTVWRLSPRGRQVAITSLGSGEWFENVFSVSRHHRTFVEADTPVTVGWLDPTTLERLVHSHPGFAVELIRSQIRRLGAVEARASQTALDTVAGSVALAILQMAEQRGSRDIRVTHEELAQRLGTVRESVSLAISKLRRAGVLAPAGRRKRLVSVPSLARLQRFVGTREPSG